MEIELRRRRIELITLSSGVIAFGVWTVVKFFLYLAVTPIDLSSIDIDPELERPALALAYALVVLLIALLQSLRLYVAFCARAEGQGKVKSRTYIVLTALMLAVNALGFLLLLANFWDGKLAMQSKLDYIVSTVVDFTSLLTLADLLFTALRVRKLRKALEG